MNICHGFARSATLWDIPILHATNLPVISAKSIPQQLLLPLDTPIPQLILKLLKNNQSGRNLKENWMLIQWLLRQL
jgi:hypothetical protein